MTVTDSQARQVSGKVMEYFGNLYTAGAARTAGAASTMLNGHGMAIGALGQVIQSGGLQGLDSSYLAKMATGGVIYEGIAVAAPAVASVVLPTFATMAGAPLFFATLGAVVASDIAAAAIVNGYNDWKANGGAQNLANSISNFANSAYGAGSEMAGALSNMLTNAFGAMTSALDSAIAGFTGAASSLAGALSGLLGGLAGGLAGLLDGLPDWLAPSNPLNPPPNDPLVIDLNRDGLFSFVGINNSKVHVDMDADGYAEKMGWVAAQDGLLTLDKNANGNVEASEILPSFANLKTYDSNNDNKISSLDSQFANLKVWQDLDSDGVTDTNELKTLSQWGIKEISLAATNTGATGSATTNTLLSTASLTYTNGTLGKIGEAALATNKLLSEWIAPAGFTVNATAQKLPELQGYGNVKDLSAAMTLNATLLTKVQALVTSSETMSAAQLRSAFDSILLSWTGANTISTSSRGQYVNAQHLAVIEKLYDGNFVDTVLFSGATSPNPNYANGPMLEGVYNGLLTSMMTTFFGQVAWSKAALSGAAADFTASKFWPLSLLNGAATVDVFKLVVGLVEEKAPADATAAYSYFTHMGTVLAGAAANVFGQDAAAYKAALISALPQNRDVAVLLGAVADMNTPSLLKDLVQGDSNANTLTTLDGHTSLLFGYSGNDVLVGKHGADMLVGGNGNDILVGGGGDDTYIFHRGNGQDAVTDLNLNYGAFYNGWGGNDTLQFGAGVAASDIVVTEANNGSDLVLSIVGTTDKVTLQNDVAGGSDYRIEQVRFADGTVLSHNALLSKLGTADNDTIYGDETANVLTGLGGNDRLMGRQGDDTLDGGAGGDTVDYSTAWNAVKVNLSSTTQVLGGVAVAAGKAVDGDGGIDTLIALENVLGTGGADFIYGNSASNTLEGNRGNDWLYGGAGADIFLNRWDGGHGYHCRLHGWKR